MRIRSLIPAAGFVLGLIAMPLQAQDASRPDFTGTWVLSIEDSEFGMSPPPDSALIEIERADDRVVMTRTTHHPSVGGENKMTVDMPADGETHEATVGDSVTDSSLEWSGDALQVWFVAESSVGDVDVSEGWTIDTNGARLTVDRLIEVPNMGEFEQTLVFDKRE